MKKAAASAPTRIDLAGGTLDIWPLYLFHPGAVTLNVAIDRRAEAHIEPLASGLRIESVDTETTACAESAEALTRGAGSPLAAYVLHALGFESGWSLKTLSRVPAGSGLGGSSALAVAIAAAAAGAAGRPFERDALWPVVRDAEAQCIGVPTGIQDYLAALYGGVNAIHLEAGRVRVEALPLDLERVEECLVLVDAGATRFSGINNWEVFKARVDGDLAVKDALGAIAATAVRVRQALLAGAFDDVAPLVAEEWQARQKLSNGVTTPEIDRIVKAALSVGGAGKVCGAGGGGMVAVWAPPPRRERAKAAIREAGFQPVEFRIDRQGVRLSDPAGNPV
jgi:D-glycero-alpha-D-manno-heptose-7-phosphate kinase